MTTIYDFQAELLEGEQKNFADYQGKVLLVVNTASQCGLTPQFEGLEKLYQAYQQQGLVILGFPCNQFANQDPSSNEEIGSFCQRNYGVSFPMFAKVDVNGPTAHPQTYFPSSRINSAVLYSGRHALNASKSKTSLDTIFTSTWIGVTSY